MNAKSGQTCPDKLEIPEVQFQEIFQIPLKNGLTRPKRVRGQGIKMVGMCEVFAHDRLGAIDMERVPLEEKETDYLLAPKDLVFARQSLVLSGAGKCSIFLDVSEPATFESHLIRARLNQDISDPMFYHYFFKSRVGRQRIEAITEQVAAAGIRSSDLARITVPLPPKRMQQSIAGYLSSLDDLIEVNKRINETLEALAHNLFKSWFIDFDPVRANAEGKQPFGMDEKTAALFPSDFEDSELGEIPMGWSIIKLEELLSILKEKLNPLENPDETFCHYSIPAFDAGKGPSLEKGASIKSIKTLLSPGCVLISKLNPATPRVWFPSLSNTVRSVCSTEFFAVLPKQFLTSEYIHALLSSDDFSRRFTALVTGTSNSHQRVKKEDFEALDVILAPRELIMRFSDFIRPMYGMQAKNMEQSTVLASMRDSLLPNMLSGEIQVASEGVESSGK